MYGAEPGKATYANNCLLARRLVERGVRFVQLYHTDWDHHADLGQPLDQVTREIDQPTAALIRDLKQRGLLDHTLVVWGGEFGRTPMGEVRESGKAGRNHHIDAYTLWMAGGGVKPGTRWAKPTNSASHPQAIAWTSTICMPRCCSCSGSTTRS